MSKMKIGLKRVVLLLIVAMSSMVLFMNYTRDSTSSSLLIDIKAGARLGNHLFPFASTWALAKRTERKAKYSYQLVSKLTSIFPDLKLETVSKLEIYWTMLFKGQLTEGGAFDYMEEWIYDLPPHDVLLCCYMQSYKYFEPFELELFQLLKFHPSIRQHASTRYLGILNQDHSQQNQVKPTFIAVHIRQGDLVTNPVLFQLGRRLASSTYTQKAMNYYRDKYPNRRFLVFSDSLSWAEENVVGDDVKFMAGGEPEQDMALMAMCDHIIITVGK